MRLNDCVDNDKPTTIYMWNEVVGGAETSKMFEKRFAGSRREEFTSVYNV